MMMCDTYMALDAGACVYLSSQSQHHIVPLSIDIVVLLRSCYIKLVSIKIKKIKKIKNNTNSKCKKKNER